MAERLVATRLAVAAVALALVAGACGPAPRPHNVVLIVVDSLRADHLGCYGHDRATSPRLDALAAEGVQFGRAYATAPWTMPSVASMLTGLHPTTHGVTNTDRKLPDDVDTLAERFARAGYRTGAVVSHHLIGRKFNYQQGFDEFVQDDARGHKYVSTQGVTQRASALLRAWTRAEGDRPFFLLVHYFDPHYDYRDHANIPWAPARAGRLDGSEGIGRLRQMLDSMTDEELGFLRARYDEEILLTDRGIGRLLDNVERLGLADGTLVAFTADHGEEFRNHGWLGHMRTLYDELVRVPLLVRGPGVPAGLRVEEPVSLVALAPTLVELSGAGASAAAFQAPSFAALVRGDARAAARSGAAPIYCQVDYLGVEEGRPGLKTTHKKAVVVGDLKLVRDDSSGAFELYDLASDPGERTNLAERRPDRVAELRELLEAHLAELGTRARDAERAEFTDDELRSLQELGYVGYD